MSETAQITLQGLVETAGGTQALGPGGTGFVQDLANAQYQQVTPIVSTTPLNTIPLAGTTFMIFVPATESTTYTWTDSTTGNTIVMTGAPWYVATVGPISTTHGATLAASVADTLASTLIYI
jgi:hypothetical protein